MQTRDDDERRSGASVHNWTKRGGPSGRSDLEAVPEALYVSPSELVEAEGLGPLVKAASF
jgi:hypothetical protein